MKRKILGLIKDSAKVLFIILGICLAYRLNVISIILCMCAGVVFNYFYQREEIKRKRLFERFKDAVMYMEQMIYSFKKQPKIRLALQDAQKIGSSEVKELLEEVIVNIDTKESEHIYEESLCLIEKEYKCKRIKSLHKFLIKIEEHGGEYDDYIDILLKDIKDWNDRTLLFIKNVERVKRNVLISVFSTVITCGFMAYIVPSEYSYTPNLVYQIASTIMLLMMMGSYLLIVKKMNIDWLREEQTLNNNQVMRYYNLVEKGYEDYDSLSWSEKLSYKSAKRRMEKELSKCFPDWIREVAINLQNDTVQSAIENSYENSPFILQRPIRKLLLDFEKYPVGIEPYDNLLKEFDLDEIKSSMKMFYSINELGKEQSDQQINSILDRNNKLAGHAEEMKNQDQIGAASMLATVPMVVGIVKIMIDMVLMIMVFTTSIGNAIN
ncbi:MAG TPA: hypothetical protein DCR28_04340 [Eubacterium sp.]|nr:hypothetical protein [Eubacterium sp.]